MLEHKHVKFHSKNKKLHLYYESNANNEERRRRGGNSVAYLDIIRTSSELAMRIHKRVM